MVKTYSEKLKDPRWQKKRLKIFERDGWKCTKCFCDDTTLNVHHLQYSGDPWEVDNSLLVTLCEKCHLLIETYKEVVFISCLKVTERGYACQTDKGILLVVFDDGKVDLSLLVPFDAFKNVYQKFIKSYMNAEPIAERLD